ncbi:MAG: phosphate acyltransferase PlsX [Candidatus Hydrogenedentota bacterium]|nr:MAG: phosphate acyltransferase PlsX [Candidatus Hydrogenedentota bacterium]
MWVAVDAASGDHGYDPMVLGAVMAVRDLNAKVILVGDQDKIQKELSRYPDIQDEIRIVHTDEVITMEDAPAISVKKKKRASVVLAAELVRDSEAVGFFSPGNTGATMAAALRILGRIDGVKRPAIATPIPRENGKAAVLIDSGANVDCKPEYLVQFGIMGEIYSREILGIINPKIGVLSNGEEDKKGNELTQAAFARLKKLPYDFVGNVETRDLLLTRKPVDVAVCDGFVGNLVLKAIEGTAKSIFNTLKAGIRESNLAKTGALLLRPTLMMVKKRMDYATYGGAPLLGVNGNCMIGHGSSSAWAVRNAIRVTMEFAQNDVTVRIKESIKRFS